MVGERFHMSCAPTMLTYGVLVALNGKVARGTWLVVLWNRPFDPFQ